MVAAAAAAAAAAPAERRSMDPSIWKACAGGSVQIPTVDSLVYYFPQGHAEQATSIPDFSSLSHVIPFSLCRISGIDFLANKETDEVYAKISLCPVDARIFAPPLVAAPPEDGGGVTSFAKILTPSDANNGGGFSVPRFCAESIFPPLNFEVEPPLQTITVRDVHGTVWAFRHIYRGTPRRNLLTTGWSKFVNSKKLVSGDSVVFIKNSSGELFIGVRRRRAVAPPPLSRPPEEGLSKGAGFSRGCRGRVPPETVVEAVRLAGMNRPFEVMYYPKLGFPEFVVGRDLVEEVMKLDWRPETRVKIAVETEDQSKMAWYQGKVSRAELHALGPFPPSPWRMLEIAWDESEVLQSMRSVSPWQVEVVSDSPQILSTYPAVKKTRLLQNQELLTDGADRNLFFNALGYSSTMMESRNPSMFSYNIHPARMQGARHNLIDEPFFSKSIPNVTYQMFPESPNGNGTLPKVSSVSTEVNVRSASQSESLSPPSQDSVLFLGNSGCKTATKDGAFLKLFGQTIRAKEPLDGGLNEGHKENESAGGPRHLSSTQKQLHDGHDVSQHEASAVNAANLGNRPH